MATRITVSVSDIERELIAALRRLVEKGPARRGFVLVSHDPTGRFFQFGTELNTRRLFYDVPQIGIVARPCTLPEGVASAMALVKRWGLNETVRLTLIEDDSESGRRRLVRKTKEWLEELREKLTPGLPALPGAA